MKALKILFITFSVAIFSCTGGDIFEGDDIINAFVWDLADVHYDNKTYFSPPEWIRGIWYSNDDYWYAVQFTQNDVINYYSKGGSSTNKILNSISWGDYDKLLLEEIATDTTYYYSIRHEKDRINGSKPVYNTLYQKISNDSILYTLSGANSGTRKYGKRG
ncbi:hypothetical protein [Tamlana flava]|uniref:hypothetical protein n=1 Tax=Tamlana flava TaxID=3158572 RepID=UPI00351B70C7